MCVKKRPSTFATASQSRRRLLSLHPCFPFRDLRLAL